MRRHLPSTRSPHVDSDGLRGRPVTAAYRRRPTWRRWCRGRADAPAGGQAEGRGGGRWRRRRQRHVSQMAPDAAFLLPLVEDSHAEPAIKLPQIDYIETKGAPLLRGLFRAAKMSGMSQGLRSAAPGGDQGDKRET